MFVQFSIFLILFISLLIVQSSGQLPAPENPIYAQEQIILDPFKVDIEEALTCGQLIEYHGFKYETHFVETKDGYILGVYRIINKAARDVYEDQLKPVLLVHGVLTSCSSFMFNAQIDAYKKRRSRPKTSESNSKFEPDQTKSEENWTKAIPLNSSSNDLAIALATREFDVWIANNRGTSYSRNHTYLLSYDPLFWNFDWVTMSRYDTPALVDYVRKSTNRDKIIYIGYSQGTQQMLTHLAEDPTFAEKLSLNILISPVGFKVDPPGLAGLLPNERPVYRTLSAYVGPIPPFLPTFNTGLTLFCTVPFFRPICEEMYFQIFGPDNQLLNHQHFPVLTSLIDTTSAKVLLQDLQLTHFGQLSYYDYGNKTNQDLYGSQYPPKINLTNVPIYNLVLISGLNDYLASPQNVQRLRNILQGPPLVDYVITYPKWSHTDLIFGDHAFQYAHSPIISIIRQYN